MRLQPRHVRSIPLKSLGNFFFTHIAPHGTTCSPTRADFRGGYHSSEILSKIVFRWRWVLITPPLFLNSHVYSMNFFAPSKFLKLLLGFSTDKFILHSNEWIFQILYNNIFDCLISVFWLLAIFSVLYFRHMNLRNS